MAVGGEEPLAARGLLPAVPARLLVLSMVATVACVTVGSGATTEEEEALQPLKAGMTPLAVEGILGKPSSESAAMCGQRGGRPWQCMLSLWDDDGTGGPCHAIFAYEPVSGGVSGAWRLYRWDCRGGDGDVPLPAAVGGSSQGLSDTRGGTGSSSGQPTGSAGDRFSRQAKLVQGMDETAVNRIMDAPDSIEVTTCGAATTAGPWTCKLAVWAAVGTEPKCAANFAFVQAKGQDGAWLLDGWKCVSPDTVAEPAPTPSPSPSSTPPATHSPPSGYPTSQPVAAGLVVESRIDGNFEGWSGETVFLLQNGQIWQQAEYDYLYHYAFSPEVIIYEDDFGYRMKVEDVDETILVRRLK